MTAPHIPSDNAAIEAAHAKIREVADLHLLTVIGEFIKRPTRWNYERGLLAMQAVADEHFAELERLAGRAPGAFREPSGRVEAWEDSRGRGSFAGLTRGPDGTLEPCGGVTVATVPANKALRKACEHRGQADFGKPVTFHGDTGPIVPVDPTIAAKDSA
jgi:hypothetical protein